MMKQYKLFSGTIFVALMGITSQASAQTYEVTVTNITRGSAFTPRLVTLHNRRLSLFTLGSPASTELATLAEEGNVTPLQTLLTDSKLAGDVEVGAGLLQPGQSQTVTLALTGVGRNAKRLSFAAMLIPTNDSFVALNGVELPESGSEVFFAPAYDAGSEINDELCSSIPGPNFSECGGPGGGAAPDAGSEGFVHISNGIQGIGSFKSSDRDWKNPVARIVVRKVSK